MRLSGWRFVARAAIVLGLSGQATAGRPLITDDASTVGAHRLQLETWVHLDRANVHQDAVLGFGPVESLELSLGARHGHVWNDSRYSIAGPLAQFKWLLFPGTSLPGLALVVGVTTPAGTGRLVSRRWESFAYAASSLFRDRFLLHLNVGAFRSDGHDRSRMRPTWGLASQVRIIGDLNGSLEMASGDPYAEVTGAILHGGFRYHVSENFQIDVTAGYGLWGNPAMSTWTTAGVRIATPALW